MRGVRGQRLYRWLEIFLDGGVYESNKSVGVCLQRAAVFYIYPVDPDLCTNHSNNHKFASRGVYSGFIHDASDGSCAQRDLFLFYFTLFVPILRFPSPEKVCLRFLWVETDDICLSDSFLDFIYFAQLLLQLLPRVLLRYAPHLKGKSGLDFFFLPLVVVVLFIICRVEKWCARQLFILKGGGGGVWGRRRGEVCVCGGG